MIIRPLLFDLMSHRPNNLFAWLRKIIRTGSREQRWGHSFNFISADYFHCCLWLAITLSSLKRLLYDLCPFICISNWCTYVMVYTFYCANSHLEMKLNDITIVCVMVQDVYTITNNDLIPPKMADTSINIWYWNLFPWK